MNVHIPSSFWKSMKTTLVCKLHQVTKTAKIIKGDITQQHIDIQAMCWQVVSPIMIFAVFDVLLSVNMCINYSFLKHLLLLRTKTSKQSPVTAIKQQKKIVWKILVTAVVTLHTNGQSWTMFLLLKDTTEVIITKLNNI